MLRLILVLVFGFIGSQFPIYYFHYINQLDADIQNLLQQNAPAGVIDTLKRQRTDLLYGDPVEWPILFIDAFDAERAGTTLGERWEPRMPEESEDWAFGGAGLIIGFFVTAILLAPFRGGSGRTINPRSARRPHPERAKTGYSSNKNPFSRGAIAEAVKAAGVATAAAAAAKARGSVPASGQPRQDEPPPTPSASNLALSAAMALSGRGAIVHSRIRPTGSAVVPTYARPAAISRRRTNHFAGPIERVTRFRD